MCSPSCQPDPQAPVLRTRTKPCAKRKRAAAQKVSELAGLEDRLFAASIRSEQSGHIRRAESYIRQASAVRQERESWAALANGSSSPEPVPNMLAALFCTIPLLFDLFVAGGNAAKRLAKAVVTIVVLLCGTVLGTSTGTSISHSWLCCEPLTHRPEHWVTEIASSELSRKGSHGSIPALLRQ